MGMSKRRLTSYLCLQHYSILSAFIGEMEAARFAGMMAAKKEQMASAPAATLSANGSHEETP